VGTESRSLWVKVVDSLESGGILKTASKVVRYTLWRFYRRSIEHITADSPSIEDRFTKIYGAARFFWGSAESASGRGSTLGATANLRKRLPKLIEAFSIGTLFDAPCGDFNWMKMVLNDIDVDYVGADIVKPLINQNNLNYGSSRAKFVHLDITKNHFPKADLWICRDCLGHLSFSDTIQTLRRFLESDIPYVLTTTNKNIDGFKNHDINTGDWRVIDLFSEPYRFDKNVLYRIDDAEKPAAPSEMCLWSRDQVANSLEIFQKSVL
jgi:hypothetical protein